MDNKNIINEKIKKNLETSQYKSIVDDIKRSFWVTKKYRFPKNKKTEIFKVIEKFIKKEYKFVNLVKGSRTSFKNMKGSQIKFIIGENDKKSKIVLERIDEYKNLYQTIFEIKPPFFSFRKPYVMIREYSKTHITNHGMHSTKWRMFVKIQLKRIFKIFKNYAKENNI